jgi:ATP-dependent DNA helicase 2 subunit 2
MLVIMISCHRNRLPWYNNLDSYNPAIHRVKQALFHVAVNVDLDKHPLPPPHPELLKYFEPPKRMLKKAHGPIERCKEVFKIKEGTEAFS